MTHYYNLYFKHFVVTIILVYSYPLFSHLYKIAFLLKPLNFADSYYFNHALISGITVCRVVMRRGATGCARVVSRRANLAAVSSQFWKTVRVAQHRAATPPCFITWYSFNSSEDG